MTGIRWNRFLRSHGCQHCWQVIPTPADDLEVGEICLLHLVDALRWLLELITRFHQDVGRAGN